MTDEHDTPGWEEVSAAYDGAPGTESVSIPPDTRQRLETVTLALRAVPSPPDGLLDNLVRTALDQQSPTAIPTAPVIEMQGRRGRRNQRRLAGMAAAASTIAVVGLAIGLAVGDDDRDDQAASVAPPDSTSGVAASESVGAGEKDAFGGDGTSADRATERSVQEVPTAGAAGPAPLDLGEVGDDTELAAVVDAQLHSAPPTTAAASNPQVTVSTQPTPATGPDGASACPSASRGVVATATVAGRSTLVVASDSGLVIVDVETCSTRPLPGRP